MRSRAVEDEADLFPPAVLGDGTVRREVDAEHPHRAPAPPDGGHRDGAAHPGDDGPVRQQQLRRVFDGPGRQDGRAVLLLCFRMDAAREGQVVRAQALRDSFDAGTGHLLDEQEVGVAKRIGRADERYRTVDFPAEFEAEGDQAQHLAVGPGGLRGLVRVVVPWAFRIVEVDGVAARCDLQRERHPEGRCKDPPPG
jgi:hypothetical protein